jgi:malonyl-CoA O-methyltransferase
MDVVPTQEGYDRWAVFYDSDDNPLIQLEELHFDSLLGDVSGLTIADVGCGTGRQSLRLAEAGARVTAVDFSVAMLQRARSKRGAEAVTFIQHDLAQPLPLNTAAFDCVTCCLVLDHIENLDAFFF